jgi:hypothetical protein
MQDFTIWFQKPWSNPELRVKSRPSSPFPGRKKYPWFFGEVVPAYLANQLQMAFWWTLASTGTGCPLKKMENLSVFNPE